MGLASFFYGAERMSLFFHPCGNLCGLCVFFLPISFGLRLHQTSRESFFLPGLRSESGACRGGGEDTAMVRSSLMGNYGLASSPGFDFWPQSMLSSSGEASQRLDATIEVKEMLNQKWSCQDEQSSPTAGGAGPLGIDLAEAQVSSWTCSFPLNAHFT